MGLEVSVFFALGALLCWVGVIAALVTGFAVGGQGTHELATVQAVAVPLGVMLVGVLLI